MITDQLSTKIQELVDGFATTSTRKLGVGGRKMVAHEVLMRRKFEKEPSAFLGGASKDISGANCSDVKCNFEVKGNFRVKYIFGEQTASTKKRKKNIDRPKTSTFLYEKLI